MKKLLLISVFLSINFSISANPINNINAKISISADIKYSSELQLELGVIPGVIFGSPLKEPLWLVNTASLNELSLSINNYRKKIKPFTKSLTKAGLDSGLVITPKETKFARVSTFGINKKRKRYENGAFFNNEGDFLILMYFDQPCRITGTVYLDIKPIKHDIHIKSEGFYWIHVKQGKTQDKLKAVSSSTPVILKFGR